MVGLLFLWMAVTSVSIYILPHYCIYFIFFSILFPFVYSGMLIQALRNIYKLAKNLDNTKLNPDKTVICFHIYIVVNSCLILSMIWVSEVWTNAIWATAECKDKSRVYNKKQCSINLIEL